MAIEKLRCHCFIAGEETELSINNGDLQTALKLWCLTSPTESEPLSKTVVFTIHNFPIWCFIELPKTFKPYGGSERNWNVSYVNSLISFLQSRNDGEEIISGELVYKSKIFYHQPEEKSFPMIKLYFSTTDAMKKFCNKIENAARPTEPSNTIPSQLRPRGLYYGNQFGGRMALRAWEGNPNDITAVRKFFTEINGHPSDWLDVDLSRATKHVPPDHPSSKYTCEEFIFGEWKGVFTPVPKGITVKASSPKIMAIDIETYTDNHLAMPVSGNPDHVIFMISVVTQRARDKSSRKRTIINLQEAPVDITLPLGVEFIDHLVTVPDEITMIATLGKLVAEYDPDIVTGYNVHTYDYNYINERLIILKGGNKEGIWPPGFSRDKKDVQIKSNSWNSSGYGANISIIPTIGGRMMLDMMSLIKREYKLERYSLDIVARHFLGPEVGKHSVTPKDMFLAYEACVSESPVTPTALAEMTRVAAYCICDSELVIDLFEKMNTWIGLIELSCAGGVPVVDVFSRGQQCRGMSLVYNKASKEDTVLDTRAFKKAFQQSREDDESDDESGKKLGIGDGHLKYKGGSVQEPIPGIHTDVLCLDFASLYPSIAIAYNISWETLNPASTPLEAGGFSGVAARHDAALSEKYPTVDTFKCADPRYRFPKDPSKFETIEFFDDAEPAVKVKKDKSEIGAFLDDDDGDSTDKKKILVTAEPPPKGVHYKFEYVNKSVKVGILPRLAEELIMGRRAVRNTIKQINGDIKNKKIIGDAAISEAELQLVVLDKRQLGLKMTANSLYGFLGAQTYGKLPQVESAMSITGKGRELIKKVNDYVVDKYGGTIIYGDSVTGDTPITIRNIDSGEIRILPIELINGDFTKMVDRTVTPNEESKGWHKEAFWLTDTEVLTKPCAKSPMFKWLPLKTIIRHRSGKPIIRVCTASGYVDVTCDHSIVSFGGEKVSPFDLKIGDKLDVGSDLELENAFECIQTSNKISPARAYSMGISFSKSLKTIPHKILISPKEIVKSFLCGFMENVNEENSIQLSKFDKATIASLRLLFSRCGGFLNINISEINVGFGKCGVKDVNTITDMWLIYEGDEEVFPDQCKLARQSFEVKAGSHVSGDYVYDISVDDDTHRFLDSFSLIACHQTDSSMFKIPTVKDSSQCDEMGFKLAAELSALFPEPLRLEYEKAMNILCLKKKKYAALLINPDGTFMDSIMMRGIVLARRDNCNLHRIIYRDVLNRLLREGAGAKECFCVIMECVTNAFLGKYEDTDFTIVKEMGVKYKSATAAMKVFRDELTAAGIQVNAGDRLRFVITTEPSSIPLPGSKIKIENVGLKMRYYDTWKESRSPPIDIMYYVVKVLKNTIDQLFCVPFEKDLIARGIADKFSFSATKASKPRKCSTPIKMFEAMAREIEKSVKKKALPYPEPAKFAKLSKSMISKFKELYEKGEEEDIEI